MRKLRLMALAATAAVVPMASAQTVPDPDPYYGVPELRLNLSGTAAAAATPAPAPAPQAGHSWREGTASPAPPPSVAPPPRVAVTPAPPARVAVTPAPPPPPPMRTRRVTPIETVHVPPQPPIVRVEPIERLEIREGDRVEHGGRARHARRFTHIRRIDRGGFVPHGWFGPQFVVRNWHGYGFPQPFAGGRWIRYYDDALLIDRYGRVHDGRYGYDWDRHRDRDRWSHDDRGVPVYVGDGDYEPEEWDYEWAERHDRRGGHGGYEQPGGYTLYPHSSGYGCGCGPVVVTETITTTAPVVEEVTYYEYVTEKARPGVRSKRRSVKTRHAPPPMHHGERG